MVTCNDCIHRCVCPIADGCEYADEQHIRDDCEYFAPSADVVPMSEFDNIPVEVAQVLQDKAVEKAKTELAREIFEEIEKVRMQHTFGDIDGSELNVRLYQLKKKYTEGET